MFLLSLAVGLELLSTLVSSDCLVGFDLIIQRISYS